LQAPEGFEGIVSRSAQQQYIGRGREQVLRFFAGTDLVEPGLVRVEEWRPDPDRGRRAVDPVVRAGPQALGAAPRA
jgi:hypothetical protein